MNQAVPLDDQRGVDVAQLRALLLPNPAERIAHTVAVATQVDATCGYRLGKRADLLFD